MDSIKQLLAIIGFAIFSPLVGAETITVEHPMGQTTLESNPQRVIVLGMDTLDVLDSLNIEPVGVVKAPMPQYLHKYQSSKYPAVGSLFEPDFETIYTLKPDLIIASNRSSESYSELTKIAPTVVFMADPANYWATTQEAWRMLGKIFDKSEQVEKVIAEKQQQIDAIKSKTTPAHQIMLVMTNGGKLTVFGAQSRYSALYKLFGFSEVTVNEENKTHGDLISYEFIANANPPYLLILDRDQAIGRDSGEAFKKLNNPLVAQTGAAKNGHIHYLNPHAWYISASGIQATQFMIDDVNAVLN